MSNHNKHLTPPEWPLRVLRRLLKPHYLEEIEGDMEERFQDNRERYNIRKARRLYVVDSLKLLQPALMKNLGGYRLNHYDMFQHQVKIVWRQTLKQKAFSAIKIGGFAIGIAACILVTLFVGHQLNHDRHYLRKDQIFRVVNKWSEGGESEYWTNVHGPLKLLLEENIPEIEKLGRVVSWSWGDAGDNHIRIAGSSYNHFEEGFIYADPELLDILEIPMVHGTQNEALLAPNRIVISRSKAEKYFPGQNPVGRSIFLNENPETTYTIGGVMEDFPATSHLKADFILTLYERMNGPGTSGWCCTNYALYTRIAPSADKTEVEEKIVSLRNTHIIGRLKEAGTTGLEEIQKHQSYYLQPVGNIYLNPERVGDNLAHGSREMAWIFGFIAVAILIMACINFVNLSTARALKRSKEVGLKKVLGSFRSGLVYQYLLESCLYTLIAVLLGGLFAWLAMSSFNELAGTTLTIPVFSFWFVPLLLVLAFVIGILSGIYPAFYLSGFQPIEALKNLYKGNGKTSLGRNALVVFQFSTTIMLIIAALVLHKQFEFLMDKSLGFEKDYVVNIAGLETMDENKKVAFKQELLTVSAVQSAALSDFLPVEGGQIHNRTFWVADRRQVDNGFEAARWSVDEDYIETLGMDIAAGRNFNTGTSDDRSIIINERMAKELGLNDPVGTEVIDMFDQRYTIIGMVKDFYFESLFGNVRPLAMVREKGISTLSVKLNTSDVQSAMASLAAVWNRFKPDQVFRYSYLDQRFAKMYDELNRAKTIFILFSILSIVIACSGLFALSLYLIGQRSKEVSIRKVLGASVNRIFWLLSFDLVRLVLIAIVIAVPVSWYFMDQLLAEIANRIELSWYIFAFAGLAVFIITLATVSFEAIKAALTNPVEQLKSD